MKTSCVQVWVPWPSERQLGARFEYLEQHPDAFDAIYFGTSNVYRSFVPAEFDAELARRGHRIRSFNLGVPGMTVFEMDHLIREVLALRSPRLRWVFFEYEFGRLDRPNRLLHPEHYYEDNQVFWHTPGRTWDVADITWPSGTVTPLGQLYNCDPITVGFGGTC